MAEESLERAKEEEAELLIQDENYYAFKARDKMIEALKKEEERVALSKLRLEHVLKIVADMRQRFALNYSDVLFLEYGVLRAFELDDVLFSAHDEYERIWRESDLEEAA